MRKGIKKLAFVFGISVFRLLAFSQPTINGPECVLPGIIYQYIISDYSASTIQVNMKICIHGGSLVNKDGSKLNDCTASAEPLATLLIMWNDKKRGSISISTSEGKKILNVNVTSELQAGFVDLSVREQNFSNTISVPSTIVCSEAKGGSCSPNYSYQWQQSNDAMTWTNIERSTGQNLAFDSPVKQSSYYRRKVIETGSATIAYSDVVVVNVSLNQLIDSSRISDFTRNGDAAKTHHLEYFAVQGKTESINYKYF